MGSRCVADIGACHDAGSHQSLKRLARGGLPQSGPGEQISVNSPCAVRLSLIVQK
jgi:hypothetical protein